MRDGKLVETPSALAANADCADQDAFFAAAVRLAGSFTTRRPTVPCLALAASAILPRSLPDAFAIASRIAWSSSTIGSVRDDIYSYPFISSSGVQMTGGS